jgi:uncharacterized repeat protein (TIGR01451 family)
MQVNYSELTTTQLANDTWLEYTIRFQNIGTDTAFTVILRDTLPGNFLQLPTLQMVASSHNSFWELRPGGMLYVKFASIGLPHAAVNAAGSMGFVRFRVRPQPTLAVGTVIPNRAAIYFDFNAPITTNTVGTTVVRPTGLAAPDGELVGRVWPNPVAGDRLQVELSLPAPARVHLTLLDAVGRTVQEVVQPAAAGRNQAAFDLNGVAPGLYLVRAEAGAARFTQRVVVE